MNEEMKLKSCKFRLGQNSLYFRDGLGSGVSDPYVIMTVGAHTHR